MIFWRFTLAAGGRGYLLPPILCSNLRRRRRANSRFMWGRHATKRWQSRRHRLHPPPDDVQRIKRGTVKSTKCRVGLLLPGLGTKRIMRELITGISKYILLCLKLLLASETCMYAGTRMRFGMMAASNVSMLLLTSST